MKTPSEKIENYKVEIENRKERESDSRRERDSQEKEERTETPSEKEKDKITPDEGKRQPLDGKEDRLSGEHESGRGLSRGELNGCHPIKGTRENTDAHRSNKRELIRIEHPKQFKANGKSYLRCSPLHTTVRLGNAFGKSEKALLDVCANAGIINKRIFDENFTKCEISHTINDVRGVGSMKTLGWSIIPIFIDCEDEERTECTVEFDIEVYIVEDFSQPLLIGLDALLDYGIELSTSLQSGCITAGSRSLKFPLSFKSNKYKNCQIKSSQSMIIPPRCAKPISFKGKLEDDMDYFFTPTMTSPRSLTPSPQIAYGVIDSKTLYLMFTNFSEHPIMIDKDQRLGEASAITFGSQYMDNLGLKIDWTDLIRPMEERSTNATWGSGSGSEPPKCFNVEVLNMEIQIDDLSSMNAMGMEKIPRTISEKETIKIAKNSAQRIQGDTFPGEDDEEQTPTPPMPSGEIFEGINLAKSLSQSQREDLVNIVKEYEDCFSNGDEIGHIKTAKATIELSGPLPPPQPNRPVGPAKRAIIDESIDKLLEWDIIEESSSPTASPVVLIWQNTKWRFCIDFRALNRVTKGDAYPMLRSDYVFAALADKKFFSLLDAIKGYHQLEVDAGDRHKTAFISHRGLYQYKRMPFGLKNAPAQFQRMMDSVLGNLRWTAALVYIDDVLIYSSSWEEHLAHLNTVMRSARKAGLKFSLEKCRFGFTGLKLLGHGLSRYGLSTLKDKVKSIEQLSVPKSLGELHRLVGMFGYYRNFIRNFAKVATPLNELKRQPPGKPIDGTQQGSGYNSKAPIIWNEVADIAFKELKRRLCTAPILAHPRFDGRPFILYTDASCEAFGAVLCQVWTPDDYEEISSEETMKAFALEQSDWKEQYLSDPAFRKIYSQIENGTEVVNDKRFTIREDGALWYNSIMGEKLCLPLSKLRETLTLSHDVLGHFGVEKTYDRISENYYRPRLSTNVTKYVQHCPECIKNKTARRKREGCLLPIDMPDGNRTPKAFESINMDLIVGLPKSEDTTQS